MQHQKRILYLVRHAKALKGTPLMSDIDRTLHETGVVEAYDIAHEMFKRHEAPQIIISSTASRAIGTALIFQRVLNVPDQMLQLSGKLYAIDHNDLYEFVASLDDRYHSVMLVGHNPSFSWLASKMDPSIIHMPTASAIKFEFEVEKWRHSSYINAHQKMFLFP
jgi:phosphohistidine phosphatase